MTLLIFLTVPSIYLFESFLPLLIGGPLIVIAAIYGSFRALAPGGEMDSGYEKVGLAMAPLGLEVTERPKVNIEVREATTGRVGPKIHGALVLSGERHGRPVSVRLGSGEVSARSEVTVRVATPEFKAKSRDGKVRPGDDVPASFAAVLRGHAQLDPLEETDGRGRPGGHRRHPQGRRARPTGSATSGSPSASPTLPERSSRREPSSSAPALDPLDRGVGRRRRARGRRARSRAAARRAARWRGRCARAARPPLREPSTWPPRLRSSLMKCRW